MDWLYDNRAWLLDGVLVAVPLALIGWWLQRRSAGASKRPGRTLRQRGGRGSINIQAGRDVRVESEERK